MKLFGHPMSTCTRKVLCLLAEKNQKADFQLVDIMKGDNQQADYKAIQPFGQVPALDDDGFVLYESRAMMRYLDATLPGPKLIPGDEKQKALVEQWVSIETSNFTPPAMKLIMQLFFGPMMGKTADEGIVAEGKKGLDRVLPVMERQLAKTAFIAGDAFSVADIAFMPYIQYLYDAKVTEQIEAQTHVAAWWKKVSDRPSWKTTIGK